MSDLVRVCVRLNRADDSFIREQCRMTNTEYNLLIRNIVRTYCLHARADATKKIDQIRNGKDQNDETELSQTF